MITGTTRLYAIIGDPIAHVRTPMAFNEYFLAQKIDAVCLPIHIGRDDLPRGWAGLKSIANLDGFIVTAPHKADSARMGPRRRRHRGASGGTSRRRVREIDSLPAHHACHA